MSDKKVAEMRAEGPKYRRKVINHTQTFQAAPDQLFPLLCPTTEFDWMDGWHCEMIYAKSLYQEYNAIFRTNYFGFDEVWVVSHFEPNRIIEFTRISEHLSIKVDARLCDNLDGTTTGNWIVNATALSKEGNEALENMTPKDEPIGVLLGALDYYVNNDSIQPLPDKLFNKR
ncbi:MAG: hypothetical protein AAF436_06605 [Myxococcota bacterium]